MSKNSTPVVTTKRINGNIEPGTIIVPEEHGFDIDELIALEAVQDCTEADLAVHASVSAVPHGKSASHAHGGRKSAAEKKKEAEAAAKAEADAKAAAKAEADAKAAADAEAAAAADAEAAAADNIG